MSWEERTISLLRWTQLISAHQSFLSSALGCSHSCSATERESELVSSVQYLAAMASMTAVLCAAPAVAALSVSASISSTSARAQLGAPLLKSRIVAKTAQWTSKTVSNGSRVNAFNVVNPDDNTKFETLSYLPPLEDEQVIKQVDYLLANGWIPAIEFDKIGIISQTFSKMPGYYDGRYWTMWKLPLFGAKDSGQVLQEVQECKKLYPSSFIRVIGFDNVKQVQVVSFIVYMP